MRNDLSACPRTARQPLVKRVARIWVGAARRVLNHRVAPVTIRVFLTRVCSPCLIALDGLSTFQAQLGIASFDADPKGNAWGLGQVNDVARFGFCLSFHGAPCKWIWLEPCSPSSFDSHLAYGLIDITSGGPPPGKNKNGQPAENGRLPACML